MNLSIGLSLTRPSGPLGFNPASLFASGEEGAWYDPSDLTTLYQDAAGITLAGVGDPVGLMLDKSKGLVLGSELVANGGFDVDASWTKGTGWTISSGEASHAAGTASYLSQSVSLTLGKTYRATCDVVFVSGGSGAFQFRSGGTTTGMTVTSANAGNTIEIFYRAEGNTQIAVFAGAGTSIVVDNISVKELPGNHATQSTSTARPTLAVTGTTPATLGSELVTNGTFDADTDWNKGTGWTITGGQAVSAGANGAPGQFTQDNVFPSVDVYWVSFTVSDYVSGGLTINAGSGTSYPVSSLANGTYSFAVTNGGATPSRLYFTPNNLYAKIDNVTVKKLLTWADPKYYLDFDGVDDTMAVTFASALTQPNTLAFGFVFDTYPASSFSFVVDGVSASNRHALYSASGIFQGFGGAILTAGSSTNGDEVAVAKFDGASSFIRRNGSSAAVGNLGTMAWGGIRLSGDRSSPLYFLNGRIYGYVGVNRTLTAGEIDDVESYLAAKSGVTL
jgi:hypothetical protein